MAMSMILKILRNDYLNAGAVMFKVDCPLITIVTPNYNYAGYIEETIVSVVTQDYDRVEHVIVDDGSTDNSVELIRGYALRYPEKIRLITQANAGQTAAVNRALQAARGDIIGWLNSDDTYCPGVFNEVAALFAADPDLDIVYGDFNVIDTQGRKVYRFKKIPFSYFIASMQGFGVLLTSNAIFWRAGLMGQTGLLDVSLDYAMDCEFFSRLTRGARMKRLNRPLANWRRHPQAKTVLLHDEKEADYNREIHMLRERYYNRLPMAKVIPWRYSWLPRGLAKFLAASLKMVNGNYFVRAYGTLNYYLYCRKK